MIIFASSLRLSLILLLAAAFVASPVDAQTKPKPGNRMRSDFATKAAAYMRERGRVTGFSGARAQPASDNGPDVESCSGVIWN